MPSMGGEKKKEKKNTLKKITKSQVTVAAGSKHQVMHSKDKIQNLRVKRWPSRLPLCSQPCQATAFAPGIMVPLQPELKPCGFGTVPAGRDVRFLNCNSLHGSLCLLSLRFSKRAHISALLMISFIFRFVAQH